MQTIYLADFKKFNLQMSFSIEICILRTQINTQTQIKIDNSK